MPKKETNQLKLPPQDIEAERSILGALMLDKNAIVNVADFLAPSDFYENKHRKIYESIIELWSKGEPVDLLTVSHALKAGKQLQDVGGIDYLTELAESVPTSAHVVHYAEIVKEQRVRRDLIAAASEISEKAFGFQNFEELLEIVEQKIFGISQKSRPQKFVAIKDELPAAYERLEKLHRGEKDSLRGVPTFFYDLDKFLSGFQPSDLIIVGARPSYGKTSLVLDIARQAAVLGKKSIGLFSIEMSKEQIIDRLISGQAQIPLWRLRTGKLVDDMEFSLVQEALNELSNAKIFIDDTPSPTILQMRSMARRLQLEHGIDMIIVDYLQLIQPRTGNDNIVQQVTEISRGLKSLARELNVPVVAVSQLSRDVDKRDVKIPRLSDLRESGSLEQDADVVLFIYRKDKAVSPMEDEIAEDNTVEIIVAKHRNGPTGTVKLIFDKEKVSFKNLDTAHAPQPEAF
ncbi:replicative DNA helicase [Patescibacteria group bacterium]|nr:replicative DNA helicase [Patescibacteria group bacterium]MCL5114354.1 replicative DNA helicase [Patescibacteria group bacterium]